MWQMKNEGILTGKNEGKDGKKLHDVGSDRFIYVLNRVSDDVESFSFFSMVTVRHQMQSSLALKKKVASQKRQGFINEFL